MHGLYIKSLCLHIQEGHKLVLFFLDIDVGVSFSHTSEWIRSKPKEITENVVNFLLFIHPSVEDFTALRWSSRTFFIAILFFYIKCWVHLDDLLLSRSRYDSLSALQMSLKTCSILAFRWSYIVAAESYVCSCVWAWFSSHIWRWVIRRVPIYLRKGRSISCFWRFDSHRFFNWFNNSNWSSDHGHFFIIFAEISIKLIIIDVVKQGDVLFEILS